MKFKVLGFAFSSFLNVRSFAGPIVDVESGVVKPFLRSYSVSLNECEKLYKAALSAGSEVSDGGWCEVAGDQTPDKTKETDVQVQVFEKLYTDSMGTRHYVKIYAGLQNAGACWNRGACAVNDGGYTITYRAFPKSRDAGRWANDSAWIEKALAELPGKKVTRSVLKIVPKS